MIVQIVNVGCIRVCETENHPPIGANRDGPKTLPRTFERVQPETGQIHVAHFTGRIKTRQNIAQHTHMRNRKSARIIRLVQVPQTRVPY